MDREIVEQPAGLSEALRAYFMQMSPEVRLFAGLLDAQVLPQQADAPAEDGDTPAWARERLKA